MPGCPIAGVAFELARFGVMLCGFTTVRGLTPTKAPLVATIEFPAAVLLTVCAPKGAIQEDTTAIVKPTFQILITPLFQG
jgi:hypothetical protein